MDFRVCSTIHWKHKSESQAGLQPTDGFQVKTKSQAAEQAV